MTRLHRLKFNTIPCTHYSEIRVHLTREAMVSLHHRLGGFVEENHLEAARSRSARGVNVIHDRSASRFRQNYRVGALPRGLAFDCWPRGERDIRILYLVVPIRCDRKVRKGCNIDAHAVTVQCILPGRSQLPITCNRYIMASPTSMQRRHEA